MCARIRGGHIAIAPGFIDTRCVVLFNMYPLNMWNTKMEEITFIELQLILTMYVTVKYLVLSVNNATSHNVLPLLKQ